MGIWHCPIQKKNPLSVSIAHENDTYYLASSELEQYMEVTHMIDAASALKQIAEANKVPMGSMVVVVDEASEFVLETLSEAGIVTERAVEADSTNLQRTMRWYKKFLKKSMYVDKDTKVKEVRERISVLEKCVEQMKRARTRASNGELSDRVIYALKDFIPFNNIYRLIKLQDVYAGIGILTNLVVAGSSLAVRGIAYTKMLDDQIKKTQEAIDYLKEKEKELEEN